MPRIRNTTPIKADRNPGNERPRRILGLMGRLFITWMAGTTASVGVVLLILSARTDLFVWDGQAVCPVGRLAYCVDWGGIALRFTPQIRNAPLSRMVTASGRPRHIFHVAPAFERRNRKETWTTSFPGVRINAVQKSKWSLEIRARYWFVNVLLSVLMLLLRSQYRKLATRHRPDSRDVGADLAEMP